MALKHSVYDSDTHFTINPTTRALKNEASRKTSLIQYDHNSERFTFELPRFIEGHDMSECNVAQVHYSNIDAKTKEQSRDVYEITDLQVSPDDDTKVIGSWLISQNATKYVGNLHFLIRFSCTEADGTINYVWNTAIYTGISISDGMYNSEAVLEEHVDVINALKHDILSNAGKSRIGHVVLRAESWEGESSPYSQVVAVEGVTENSQVDLTPSVEQLTIFHQKDLAFVTENDDGIVTVYAIGDKPVNDYTIQVTITEVTYE